jgi:hypothetical protein
MMWLIWLFDLFAVTTRRMCNLLWRAVVQNHLSVAPTQFAWLLGVTMRPIHNPFLEDVTL